MAVGNRASSVVRRFLVGRREVSLPKLTRSSSTLMSELAKVPQLVPMPETAEQQAARARVISSPNRVERDMVLPRVETEDLVEDWTVRDRKSVAHEKSLSEFLETNGHRRNDVLNYQVDSRGKYTGVLPLLDEKLLERSYTRLQAKKLSVFRSKPAPKSRKYFRSLARKIKTGGYEFKPTRTRKLANGPFGAEVDECMRDSDLIVAEALREVLDGIFDPTFADCSCGDRAGLGIHAALHQIHNNWTGVFWMLHWDLTQELEQNMSTQQLLDVLGEKILDNRLLNLVKSYADADLLSSAILGNSLYRLLCNIYLHRLDLEANNLTSYYESKIQKNDGGKSPEFVRVRYIRNGPEILAGLAINKDDAKSYRDDLTDYLVFNLGLFGVRLPPLCHIQQDRILFSNTIITGLARSPNVQTVRRKAIESAQRTVHSLKLLQRQRKSFVEKLLSRLAMWSLSLSMRRTGGLVPTDDETHRDPQEQDYKLAADVSEDRESLWYKLDAMLLADEGRRSAGRRPSETETILLDRLELQNGPRDFAETLANQQVYGNLDFDYVSSFRNSLAVALEDMKRNITWTELPPEVHQAFERAESALAEWERNESFAREDCSWNWDDAADVDKTAEPDERMYLAPRIVFVAPVLTILVPLLNRLRILEISKSEAAWLSAFDEYAIVSWVRNLQESLRRLYSPCVNRPSVSHLVGVLIRLGALRAFAVKYDLSHIKSVAACRNQTLTQEDSKGHFIQLQTLRDGDFRAVFRADVTAEDCTNLILRPVAHLAQSQTGDHAHDPEVPWEEQLDNSIRCHTEWVAATRKSMNYFVDGNLLPRQS